MPELFTPPGYFKDVTFHKHTDDIWHRLLVKDIVTHYEQRTEVLPCKAMIVCMSRRIAVDLYQQIIKLRPEL